MDPTPLSPIAKFLEKTRDLAPVTKRHPVIAEAAGSLRQSIAAFVSRKEGEMDLAEKDKVVQSWARYKNQIFPLPLDAAQDLSSSQAEIAALVRKYGILKSINYLGFKTETSTHQTVPVPPTGMLRAWEKICLSLPSLSLLDEDDYI